MAELESENRKMREPLEAARKEMEILRHKADNFEKMRNLQEVRNDFNWYFSSHNELVDVEHEEIIEKYRKRIEKLTMGVRSVAATILNRKFEFDFLQQ